MHLVKILACTAFLICTAPAAALAQQTAQGSEQQETRITSLRMDYTQNANQVVFTDEVYVQNDDLELWSDKMVVDLVGDGLATSSSAPAGQGGSTQVKQAVATGKVRLKKGRFHGTCRKAVWLAQKDIVVLTGDPVLNDGKNVLKGDIVRLYLAEDRSEVEGSTKHPVEMLFTSPKKSNQQQGAQ